MEVNNNKVFDAKTMFIAGCILILTIIILILIFTFYGKIELISDIDKECMKFTHLNSQYGKIYGNLSQEQKDFILNNCV